MIPHSLLEEDTYNIWCGIVKSYTNYTKIEPLIKSAEKYLLRLTFIATFFYPAKGIFSLIAWLCLDLDISKQVVIVYSTLTALLLLLSCVLKGYIKRNYESYIFIACTGIGLFISLIRTDFLFMDTIIILFIFPFLLSWSTEISDDFFYRVADIFFKFTIVYILIEGLIIQLNFFGEITANDILEYSAHLTLGTVDDIPISDTRGINVAQYGGVIGGYRSGGYLGNMLAMPPLVLISFVFQYAKFCMFKGIKNGFWAFFGGVALGGMVSFTAMLAGIVTVIFNELIIKKRLSVLFILTGVVTISFMYIPFFRYMVMRTFVNISDHAYMSHFLGFDTISLKTIIIFLCGRWSSVADGIPSHVDYFNILFGVGIVPTFFICKKWWHAISPSLTKVCYNKWLVVNALLLISVIASFIHHQMGFTKSTMLIATLFLIKSENFIRKNKYIVY